MKAMPFKPETTSENVGRFNADGGIEVGGCLHHLTDRTSPSVTTTFERTIRMEQMRNVVNQLALKGREASWAMFMFYTGVLSSATDDQCINLQYSIENGQLGLDWILLGERNISDQELIRRFASRRGHTLIHRETNDVRYLRIENGDIHALGLEIAETYYGVPLDADIGLLLEGFTLVPLASN
jgi:hypothetical protein